MYWSVSSVGSAREQLLERGATPHRGPIEVEHRRSICQLRDPYGNIFGLDGPP
jgi:predicted enzyme related to lactoylglutathione lyase